MKKYYVFLIITLAVAIYFHVSKEKETIASKELHLKGSKEAIFSLVDNYTNDLKIFKPLEPSSISSTENTSKDSNRQPASIVSEEKTPPLHKITNHKMDLIDDNDQEQESPQAVLDWSADIGFMMLKAFDDPQYADKVFRDLQTCSENNSLQMVFRAVCAANMKRLSEQRGEAFGQRYASIHSLFPDEIKGFLEDAYTAF